MRASIDWREDRRGPAAKIMDGPEFPRSRAVADAAIRTASRSGATLTGRPHRLI
jgi:hypothetical protein